MATTTVTTSAKKLPISDEGGLIQNLGAVDLFVDADPGVTTATGFKVATNRIMAVPGGFTYYAITTTTCDVRTVPGTGVYS